MNAAITLTFDSADSDISAGLYAFDLLGVPTSPTPTYNSQFTLFNVAPTGNTATLVNSGAPSGWNLSGPNDTTSARWYFENTAGAVNGIFEITGTPNLHGMIDWQYAAPDQNDISGPVTIGLATAPEPAVCGVAGGLGALVLCAGWRRPKLLRALAG